MADDDRPALLSEYHSVVHEERVLWKKLNEAELDPVEGVKVYARWKSAAERGRMLAAELRQGRAAPSDRNT